MRLDRWNGPFDTGMFITRPTSFTSFCFSNSFSSTATAADAVHSARLRAAAAAVTTEWMPDAVQSAARMRRD